MNDIYKLYRKVNHTKEINDLEELLNNTDPHTLRLLIAISLGYGYKIKTYDHEKEELINGN
jgi:hypothetical protein